MAYVFRILSPTLHPTACAAIKWFEVNWGIHTSSVQVEAPVHADINLRPTFVAATRDGHVLCIEVSETIYSNTLDSFVIDCRDRGLRVKLFVAVPKGLQDPDYSKKLKQAKRVGVGLLEVAGDSGDVVLNALSLSLTGLRPIAIGDFPMRYRQGLQQAEHTFRDGQPSKACSLVYDELEAAFRTLARKCKSRGWWKNPNSHDISKAPWVILIDALNKELDRAKCKTLLPVLLTRVHGVTAHRNDSGHKLPNQKKLMRRDAELRTRFESAVDLFRDLIAAARPLQI